MGGSGIRSQPFGEYVAKAHCIWHAYVFPSSTEDVLFSFNTLNCSLLLRAINDLSGIHLRQWRTEEWILIRPFFLGA